MARPTKLQTPNEAPSPQHLSSNQNIPQKPERAKKDPGHSAQHELSMEVALVLKSTCLIKSPEEHRKPNTSNQTMHLTQIKGSAIISSHAKSIKVAKNDIQTQLLANPLNTDISRPPNPPPTTMAWLVGNEHAMVATKTSRVGAVNVQGVWRDAALAAPERFLGCVGRQGLWYRPQVLKLLLHCNRSS